MKIITKRQKELIEVLHNSLEEMHKNVERLKSEGWSDDFWNSYSRQIPESEVETFKKNNPSVEVYMPNKGSLLRSMPYVYVTIHEKDIM